MTSRQLSIKTGVVNRLVKEVASYKREAEQALEKAEKMESEQADEYDLRQQRRIHTESAQMVPDSEKRLAKAIDELQELVTSSSDELGDTEEYTKAKQALENASK